MAIKRKDFQKLSSTVQEFLLKLPDEEASARLRDNLLHALHYLQLYYRVLQNRDKNTDNVQWTIDHSLSPLTPFKEAPDKFEWDWVNVESQKVRQSFNKSSIDNFKSLPAIIVSIREGDLQAVKEIASQDSSCVNSTDMFMRDCITYAIQYEKMDILKYLIQNGAKTNIVASDSSTHLHRAVYKGNPEAVEILLNNKANINAQDCYNRAPLHWSVITKQIDCLKILLKYNPNTRIKDKDGMSPSMWACYLDHLEHFKLLNSVNDSSKSFKLDETDADNDGRTWIHWSVRKNEPLECLKYLINADTALVKDKEGKTCLHVAAEQGAVQACQIIIDTAGAKVVNDKDNKKQTPLHLATLHGHAKAIKILMDKGADVTLKDLTGASAIDYVTKRNLIFCNSIIEVCLRKGEPKQRQGAGSSNSVASSFNGSEINLTPVPPSMPKNSYSRVMLKDLSGRPPRPLTNTTSSSLNASDSFGNTQNGTELSKTAPATMNGTKESADDELRNTANIPPSPPTVAKTSNYRTGWASAERILSGSLRLSRASTRTSLASDDLEKYMNGGASGMLDNFNSLSLTNDELHKTASNKNNLSMLIKPLPQPRVPSSGSINNNRIQSGRAQETAMSAETPLVSSNMVPPPIKPRKSSSISNLNTPNYENQTNITRMTYQNSSETNLNKITNANLKPQMMPGGGSSNNLDVEDVSGSDISITSVKGEGFGSDLSDTETKANTNQMFNGRNNKQMNKKQLNDANYKRPTTPMDIRNTAENQQPMTATIIKQHNRTIESAVKNVRFQPFNEMPTATGRFNEWDPFRQQQQPAASQQTSQQQQQQQQMPYQLLNQQNERQKSPLKPKQSNFAHSFLTTDSSPRQASGRINIGSATQKLQQLTSHTMQNMMMMNASNQSAAETDLIISGQKLGPRKDSPTNTPRDSFEKQTQPSPLQSAQLNHQPSANQQRMHTRRLQPLDRSNETNGYSSSNEGQNQKKKGSKLTSDRKKLEPLKQVANGSIIQPLLQNMNSNSTSHVETVSTGHSLTENTDITQNYLNDEDQSLSENTISSDKQPSNQMGKKKKSAFNKNRKKLIEPILGNDEALKM